MLSYSLGAPCLHKWSEAYHEKYILNCICSVRWATLFFIVIELIINRFVVLFFGCPLVSLKIHFGLHLFFALGCPVLWLPSCLVKWIPSGVRQKAAAISNIKISTSLDHRHVDHKISTIPDRRHINHQSINKFGSWQYQPSIY